MSSVTMIGLGAMGLALARRLAHAGFEVRAWNRTAPKAGLQQPGGVRFESDLATAVLASPVVIICVTNYEAARAVLADREVALALKGKLLVQLSSGTPQDARDADDWARAYGVEYVDGAIMATPSQIGSAQAAILVSGLEDAWLKARPVLSPLAANVAYLGGPPGLAAAADIAILSYLFCALLGFYHGANVYRAEGLPIAAFGAMLEQLAPTLTQMVRHEADTITNDSYHEAQSSARIVAETADTMARHAQEAGIDREIPAFLANIFGKAVTAGLGEQQVAALFKILRGDHV